MKRFTATTALATGIIAGTMGLAHAQSGGPGASLCTAGYTKVDSNDDGSVTPQELQAASEREFSQLDANGDGTISQQEYVDCRNALSGTQSAESDRSSDNMTTADANDDGTLTQQEFMSGASEARRQVQQTDGQSAEGDHPPVVLRRLIFVPLDQEQADENLRQMGEDDVASRSKQMFDALDSDDNAELSGQEWSRRSVEYPDRSEELSTSFDSMDANSDDSISREEYADAQMQAYDYSEEEFQNMRDTSQLNDSDGSASQGAGKADASGNSAPEEGGIPVIIFRMNAD